MREIGTHQWPEIFECDDPHKKVENFHQTLFYTLNKIFQEKTVKMITLDKTWFNPALKLKYNKMQEQFSKMVSQNCGKG